jgi:hypothetical protein
MFVTTERYDLEGVRNLILDLSDVESVSIYTMAKLSNLNHTTLWAILYRKNRKEGNSIHRKTIKALGDGLGYEVRFNSKAGTVKFSKVDSFGYAWQRTWGRDRTE